MTDIDTDGLVAEMEALSRDVAREAAGVAFSASQEALYVGGDDHGYEVAPVAQSGIPPQWDEERGGFVFAYPHTAAQFFNDGTSAHPVEPDDADVLAFEWPDAPAWVREEFADTFPTVFLPRTHPDGINAIHYLESGMQAAADHLDDHS